jgi:hypothetical protein
VERTAMCHCGQLKVIASGEPELVGICHCSACQRRTGSAVPTNAFYLRSAVRIEGKSKRYERAADSGRNIRCYFCPDCGSTLYWEPAIYPTIFGVAVGAFADPDFPPPTFSIWEEAMHPWMDAPTVTAHHPQGRPAATRSCYTKAKTRPKITNAIETASGSRCA